ncbi:dipeptide/oligopeptide/nickel ABC transporter permease/ATP-binding protein [Rathayibacter sp. VKM Ac-2760]|uniref:dipeptide/oligopeptide/nickel ABC transporter permease/ATP-binding protein n=1 Tax=Rathayibacter sp. VKM Ac-2760 TaxID=2609253 RepID=UPI001318CF72|nr:dipeptide/oligopeptide/nickel ABC transporter permease/ATP-binding protein [Rathayibacter sp. VKM Ac-2760]QHC58685.1 ATP-binding cassette domain-containing protein [Rathayibacter sp. VKM Ac-2760]
MSTARAPRAARIRRPDSIGRRLIKKPVALVSLGFIVALALAIVFASVVAPIDPLAQDLTAARQLPSAVHWLGTDDFGRDVYSRIIHGGAQTLGGAALATLIATAIGLPLGMIAGYYRGVADIVISRIADVFQALPLIILLMAVIGVFGNDNLPAMVTLGVAVSDGFIRLARATTLQVRRELYVDAANVAGLASGRILHRHILPNIRGPLLVQISLTMGITLMIQAGLGFLGLGTPPPAPSWGGLIANASEMIYTHPWLLVPPGAILILSILAFNTLGDALAEDRPGAAPTSIRSWRSTRRPAAAQPVATDPTVADDRSAAISVRDLTVSFTDANGDFSVVQGVSFDVQRGESLGIVGESGCGKSVTAKALLGLVAPGGRISGGSVLIGGVDIVGMSARELQKIRGSRIALVSQEPMVALDPSFTIGAQLRESIRHHTGRRGRAVQERALELLGLVGIPDPAQAAASHTFQVSGGMAQRAAIAMALTGEPDVLVADEPTTALDVTVQAEILDLLRSLREDLGMAVVIVTHDLGVVADACDRGVVMYAGQVIEKAGVGELLARPTHPYTVGLLSSMPSHARRGVPMLTIPGAVPPPRAWPTGCRFAARCAWATDECREAPVALHPEGDAMTRCIRSSTMLAGIATDRHDLESRSTA